jgi:hypothetical protein
MGRVQLSLAHGTKRSPSGRKICVCITALLEMIFLIRGFQGFHNAGISSYVELQELLVPGEMLLVAVGSLRQKY